MTPRFVTAYPLRRNPVMINELETVVLTTDLARARPEGR